MALLGIDLGTSGVKAVVIDERAQVLGERALVLVRDHRHARAVRAMAPDRRVDGPAADQRAAHHGPFIQGGDQPAEQPGG